MSKSGFQILQEESPKIAATFKGLIEQLTKPSALDPKTKHLRYIALKIVAGDQSAVITHVPMAKKFGATCEEIRETVILTLTVVVLKGINQCLASALETYDET